MGIIEIRPINSVLLFCTNRFVTEQPYDEQKFHYPLDKSQNICYHKNTIESARGTAPMTARQPAGEVRWQRLNDGWFFWMKLNARLSMGVFCCLFVDFFIHSRRHFYVRKKNSDRIKQAWRQGLCLSQRRLHGRIISQSRRSRGIHVRGRCETDRQTLFPCNGGSR